MKKLPVLILATCAAVLLVVMLSALAPTAKADAPSCGYNGVFVPTGGGNGYCTYPDDPQPNPIAPVAGTGGGGWPQQCNADGYQWYYVAEAMIGYVDPDYFYSIYGCYPY